MNKALMIGLDGATFSLLNPLMEAGLMPFLKRFIADGTHGELARRTEYGVHHQRYERGVKSVDRRQAGDEGVCHSLWNQHDPDGESGRKILFQQGFFVRSQPS